MFRICFQYTDITGAFHQSFHFLAHGLYAIGQKQKQGNQAVFDLLRQCLRNFLIHRLHCYSYTIFSRKIFLLEYFFLLRQKDFHLLLLCRIDVKHRLGFPTDGIIHIAALCQNQIILHLFPQCVQYPPQQAIGTGPLQMNIRTGMTALQSPNRNGKRLGTDGSFLAFYGQINPHAPSAAAADHQAAFFLRIHIQKALSLQIESIKFSRTTHTDFFFCCKNSLYGRVLHGFTV